MIKTLLIKNYAIIEEVNIDFSEGLTIITGETGAGKSILLGALGLIMGERADLKSFFNRKKKCIVEAVFEVESYNIREFFELNDLDYDNEVVLRREINPSGKSRAFINDSPVKLDVLKNLTGALIDLHQQFDTLDIHSVSYQLRMIDALANNSSTLTEYQKTYSKYKDHQKELKSFYRQSAEADKEMDFLNFQLEELHSADLPNTDQGALEQEIQLLQNAESIKQNLAFGYGLLQENEHPIIAQLQNLHRQLNTISAFDPKVKSQTEQLNGAIIELEELSTSFMNHADQLDFDEARIAEIEEKLTSVYKLQKKHNCVEISHLIDIQIDIENRLSGFEDLTIRIEEMEALIDKEESRLHELAEQLNASRKDVLPDFEARVHNLLGQLSMNNAQFKAELKVLEDLSKTGKNAINFLFSANKGGRLQSIKEVASGGELARLTLITKSLVAASIPLPTLIFDEIDIGVSGNVAIKMGVILKNLSEEHQVVVITHSPQIAARANRHYFIYKEEGEERTYTKMKELNNQGRIKELAVMLSQNPPSKAALDNAQELIELQ